MAVTAEAAVAEHRRIVAAFIEAIALVPEGSWHRPPTPARWSAAALALHVADSYQYGVAAAHGRATMQLRVPRIVAWFSRTVLLPRLLAAERFPSGARAPAEVVPDHVLAATLPRDELIARVRATADAAEAALLDAHTTRPQTRIVHANFGGLPPLVALRLLSAHTRHHTAGLYERAQHAAAGGPHAMP